MDRRQITERLQPLLPRMRVAQASKDLGVLLSAAKRRITTVLSLRIKAGCGRMWRTRGLAKVDRRARRLLSTGALPATLWGG